MHNNGTAHSGGPCPSTKSAKAPFRAFDEECARCRHKRDRLGAGHIDTPDVYQICSKRSFDGQVRCAALKP